MHKIMIIFDVVFLLHAGFIKVSIISTSLSGITKHENSVFPQERFSRDWPSQSLQLYLGGGEPQFLSNHHTIESISNNQTILQIFHQLVLSLKNTARKIKFSKSGFCHIY